MRSATGATVFAYHVHDPERYGVVEFDADGAALQHRGKAGAAQEPATRSPACTSTTTRCATSPAEHQAVARGELEITEVNARYLNRAS